jgi:hypothetical protein
MQIFVGVHAADDATPCAFFHVHSEPPGSTVLRRLRQDRMPGQDSHVTGGQALLESHASARQNLTARCSRAADRSGERHGRSIGVGVRPHRDALRRQPTKRSIAVRVRPPGNWPTSIDYRCDARAHRDAEAAGHAEPVPARRARSPRAPTTTSARPAHRSAAISTSTSLHLNTHLSMWLKGIGFADRDAIPWGIWDSAGRVRRWRVLLTMRDRCG